MAELVLQPDQAFIQEVLAGGGADLKKCYQCATCSTVCALSPGEAPFPRKQMLLAQWGLKDRVLGDPAIWLCHSCGDCTVQCPRGARPGDVMGALRQQAIQYFAWPQALARLVNHPKTLWVIFLIPVLIFGALGLWGPETVSERMEFANEYPIPVLEALFFTVSGLVVLSFAVSLGRFIRSLRVNGATSPILPNLLPVLGEILAHTKFKLCQAERGRYAGHLLALFGFVGLGIVGTVIGVGNMLGLVHTPLPLASPLKILANASTAVILIGVVVLLTQRLRHPERRQHSTYFDWWLLWVLAGVVVTGLLSELLRLLQLQLMYGIYFIHLVLVFSLLAYAPYSKLAHLVYRTVALAASRNRPA